MSSVPAHLSQFLREHQALVHSAPADVVTVDELPHTWAMERTIFRQLGKVEILLVLTFLNEGGGALAGHFQILWRFARFPSVARDLPTNDLEGMQVVLGHELAQSGFDPALANNEASVDFCHFVDRLSTDVRNQVAFVSSEAYD
jgi:hypothetical protein